MLLLIEKLALLFVWLGMVLTVGAVIVCSVWAWFYSDTLPEDDNN